MEYAIDAAGSNHDIVVRCRELTKVYGAGDASVMALRGIDLDVRRGELLMVVGPSGCGKTTLISVIAAILNQDSGQCEVLGHDLKNMGQKERTQFRGESIGYVFQMFNLLPALSAVENVSIPLLINGASRKNAEARATEALEAVGLGTRRDALPAQLSGGQQQRVAIMRAAMMEPDVMLLDEPMAALDPIIRRSLQQELKSIFQRLGKTVLLVTHDLGEAVFLAEQITLLHEGKIVQSGTYRDLLLRPADPFVTAFINAQRTVPEAAEVA